jgi:hypothetical protein
MRGTLALAIWIATAGAALAQPRPSPGDSVTVTGQKEREAIDAFIQSLAAPNRLTGKLARWETGICPVTVGLRKEAAQFITARLKEVAAQVDAPVDMHATCKPNIEIVFTTAPQGLMDNVRKKQSAFLGYADTAAQRDRLAVVERPIQAWYTTATKDLRGGMQIDSANSNPVEVVVPDPYRYPPFTTLYVRQGAKTVTGGRLGDGMRTVLYHVIVVADPTKLVEEEIGNVADYIALVVLSQVHSLDRCQSLSSIANLLPQGCEKPSGLTVGDMGYLRGLYHMNAEQALRGQRDFVAHQMEQAQAGR